MNALTRHRIFSIKYFTHSHQNSCLLSNKTNQYVNNENSNPSYGGVRICQPSQRMGPNNGMLYNSITFSSFKILHIQIMKQVKTCRREFSDSVKFKFIEEKDPSIVINVEGSVGESILDVALKHNIDIEGACGGEMACSTCHVILTPDLFNILPEKTEEEQDMLDLAWGLKPT